MDVLRKYIPGSRVKLAVKMLGLDDSGKTTILYQLLNKSSITSPTSLSLSTFLADEFISEIVGSNIKTVALRSANVDLTIWDFGGQEKIRPLWRSYYHIGTQTYIFVISSQDRERMEEAKQELNRIRSDREMRSCPLLIFANKQDLPGAMTPAEITDALGLNTMNVLWKVQPCCAISGEGLLEGIKWFLEHKGDV